MNGEFEKVQTGQLQFFGYGGGFGLAFAFKSSFI